MIYKNSLMDTIYYTKQPALLGSKCQVRFDENIIVVDYQYDGDSERVLYEGKSLGEGHYVLKSSDGSGEATLHRFKDSVRLEGNWVEDGVKGMWVITLIE